MWGALFLAALSCQGAYKPGHYLGWNRYNAMGEVFHEASHGEGNAARALAVWNAEIQKELGPALLEVFTNPCTKVFYGDFTDPEERRIGKYSQLKDDAAGLRVIWQLELPIGGGESRLLSAIAFWDYDFTARKPKPLTGPDSLRLRVETVKFHKTGMMGLSYVQDPAPDGSIQAVRPGVYIDDKGEDLIPGVSVWARTDHCNSCHGKERNKYTAEQINSPYSTMPGYQDYLAWLARRGVTRLELDAMKAGLARPRVTFLPAGLVGAIRRALP